MRWRRSWEYVRLISSSEVVMFSRCTAIRERHASASNTFPSAVMSSCYQQSNRTETTGLASSPFTETVRMMMITKVKGWVWTNFSSVSVLRTLVPILANKSPNLKINQCLKMFLNNTFFVLFNDNMTLSLLLNCITTTKCLIQSHFVYLTQYC